MRTFLSDHRFEPHQSGQTVDSLVIVPGSIPGIQFVGESSVSIDPVNFGIKMPHLVQQLFILALPGTLYAAQPFVVRRSVQVQQAANRRNGIAFLFMQLLYGQVKLLLSYAA